LLLSGHDPSSPEVQKYMYRALKFAEFLGDDSFLKEARRPDCPFSLYEGYAGTMCFLANLLNPEKSSFPFLDISYNYSSSPNCSAQVYTSL